MDFIYKTNVILRGLVCFGCSMDLDVKIYVLLISQRSDYEKVWLFAHCI